jgi:type I restriction enzyme S subunit
MGQGSSQQNLSKNDVLDFVINLPHIEEQQKIANFLTTIDEKINQQQAEIEKVSYYKKGLLQQMFC